MSHPVGHPLTFRKALHERTKGRMAMVLATRFERHLGAISENGSQTEDRIHLNLISLSAWSWKESQTAGILRRSRIFFSWIFGESRKPLSAEAWKPEAGVCKYLPDPGCLNGVHIRGAYSGHSLICWQPARSR